MKNIKVHKESTADFVTLDRLGSHINVPVRYSNKAKQVTIRISYKGAELVLPNKNLTAGRKFLLEKEFWVRQKLDSLSNKKLIDKRTIPVFGKTYSLSYIDADYYNVQIKNDIIQVYSFGSNKNHILINFLQNKLLLEVVKIATILGKQHNLKFTDIKIMNNKTKWGSCSSKGVLSFNWRLIFAPQEVIKYLVVHEMCHIVEMNHSERFWNLVAELYPAYKVAKLWLKENTIRLHQYLNDS